jgi:uncharacterized protein (TIGR03085 family)
MTSLARGERAALVGLLRETGPDATTLCEGWTTYDLAAHLVTRESQPLAAPGLMIGRLHPITEAFERRAKRTPYPALLDRVDAGPPRWSLGGLSPALDNAINLTEFFVHHEDVRRPRDDTPRALPVEQADALWRTARGLARALGLRRSLRVTLAAPERDPMTVGRGPGRITVRGDVGEIVLWLFRRRSVARVQVEEDSARRQA